MGLLEKLKIIKKGMLLEQSALNYVVGIIDMLEQNEELVNVLRKYIEDSEYTEEEFLMIMNSKSPYHITLFDELYLTLLNYGHGEDFRKNK